MTIAGKPAVAASVVRISIESSMRTGSPAGAVSGRVAVVGTGLGLADTGRVVVVGPAPGRADVGTDVAGAADAGREVEGDETAVPPPGGNARSTDDDAQALANSNAHPTRYPPRHRTPQCWPTPTGPSTLQGWPPSLQLRNSCVICRHLRKY